MENNILIQQYYEKFNEMPPIITTVATDNENYLKLVALAIIKNRKIDESLYNKVFKGEQVDISKNSPKKDNFKHFKKGAKKW